MNRRWILRAGALAAGGFVTGASLAIGENSNTSLAPWQPGYLDIHHINTGRGNSTLLLMPDGTSLLLDAGASATKGAAMCAPKPDASRRPGEWLARYVARSLGATGKLDYALLTHFHGDHVGDPEPDSPRSKYGDYALTGMAEVAEAVRIDRIIDRGYPAYDYPLPVSDAAAKNYVAFARSAAGRGVVVEQARVGSAGQISLRRDGARYPEYTVRVVAANGRYWTGKGDESEALFPAKAAQLDRPNDPALNRSSEENGCSIALRIAYGRFSYFTGGDLNCDTNYGRDPWRDVESRVAQAVGPVSVATCNHHGYFDANGPDFVRALAPRAWVLQSWHASHPALSTLANLYSPVLYAGERDVFCLGLHPAAALACGRFSDRFKSSAGHVVIRVAPGGATFSVFVVSDEDESGRVKAAFGPYRA